MVCRYTGDDDEFLRCYCGEQVTCYHTECKAMVEPKYEENHDRLYNGVE